MTRPAPIGARVTVTYDADPNVVIRGGEYLRTPKGRCYLVLERYKVDSRVHDNRWRIYALVIEKIPPNCGRRIHALVFYPRGK